MPPCPQRESYLAWALTGIWHRGGWIGVDLFFVLSGFLVSGLIFGEYRRRGQVSIGRFLIRRGLKIYPAFWTVLCITVLAGVGSDAAARGRPLLGELLFLQNYIGGVWNHTWSLAVEEHFYLFLALLASYLMRARPCDPFSRIPTIFTVVAVVCLGLRIALLGTPYAERTHLFPTHLRIDSLLFGVVLAYYWHFRSLATSSWLAKKRRLLIICGLAMLLPAFVFPLENTPWITATGLTVFYLGSGALLIGTLASDIRLSPLTAALSTIGTFSYSIYLWHMPVRLWGVGLIEGLIGKTLGWFPSAAVYLFGSIIVGIIAAKAIELPLLKIRNRLFPSY
jgi:peptidoglycan/LPS O-acetylase OafA/YrhL